MKKTFIAVLTVSILALLSSFTKDVNETDYSLAKVNKYSGKYCFWLNEPVAPYKEVFTFKSTISACATQSAQAQACVKEAVIQSASTKIEFDAVIIGTTDRDIAICFTDTSAERSYARVKKTNGVYVFYDCSPLSSYTQMKREKEYRKQGSKCIMSSQIVNIITKKGAKYQGLIVGDDYLHWWIDFN